MSHLIKQQYQANRDALKSYRLRAKAALFVFGIGLTTGVVRPLADPSARGSLTCSPSVLQWE
jgi:hypothetical protein